MSHPSRRVVDRFATGVAPVQTTVIGIAVVILIGVVLGPFPTTNARTTEALLLVVPVIGAAVRGGRHSAYIVAAAATVEFSLLIPPAGSMRIRLSADLVALGVFSAVAIIVSTIVAHRFEALDRVERQRVALLRSVSHDFRTPLSAVRAASSELLHGEAHDARTRARLLELITDESDRLDRLVANLLSLSRIEAGMLEPRRQAVDIGELLSNSARRLERLFLHARLELDVAPNLPIVQADYTQLEQVITNLLENAVRHTPEGRAIQVSAAPARRTVVLRVSDSGPGVDPAEAEAIFEPFRSGRIAGSSGIGLAICRAIIEAHDGTISVSESPSGGAAFTVTLPV